MRSRSVVACAEPEGFVGYFLYVSTPTPDGKGATGHGLSGQWPTMLRKLEEEASAGEELFRITGRRSDGSDEVLLDVEQGVDALGLLSAPELNALGPRSRPSALAC